MALTFNILIVIGASLIEGAAGYPAPLLARAGHPVMWMGALLGRLEAHLNDPRLSPRRRRLNGAIALGVLLVASVLAATAIQVALLGLLPNLFAILLLAICASTLLAQRSLYDHVAAVADALARDGVEEGRIAVAKIVGRDTADLDEAGVARAAIESLAENFSDGVVAPCVFGVVAGLPGMSGYKAVNTADSMIGHRTPRHEAFGFAAAKLDDLLNLIPARLSALLIALAALFHADASPRTALRIAARDAKRHRSPNAGWPESAMAGALGLRLSGPRLYHRTLVDEPWIGDGVAEIGALEISRALAVYRTACLLQTVVLALLVLLTWRA